MTTLSENKTEWPIDKILILNITVAMYQQYQMCKSNCYLVHMPQNILPYNFFKSLVYLLRINY